MKIKYQLLKDLGSKNKFNLNGLNKFNSLINNEWETRPKSDAYWVFRNYEILYVLYITNKYHQDEFIGFSVIDNDILEYFEIMETYRNKKYGTKIIKKMINDKLINKVSILERAYNFWIKFFDKKDIIIE